MLDWIWQCFFFKGTLLGAIVGISITSWLSMMSLTSRKLHERLPPVSTEKCSFESSNSTLFSSSLNYSIDTSNEVFDISNFRDNWNQTSEALRHAVSGEQFLRKDTTRNCIRPTLFHYTSVLRAVQTVSACIVLYCIVLYSCVLYCIALHCIVFYCIYPFL